MLDNSGYVMTLANSIIGVGILAMPFCFQKCGIVLAILLLILSNWITRVCCHYLIKASLLTRRRSFEFLGFHAFGASGKLLVELCIIGYLLGTCITYFVVVGDLGPQIVTKIFSLENEHRHLRTLLMCGVTLFCIIPLGMLKNVDSLSAVCTASVGFYICLVIKIILESETHLIANDWKEKVTYWQPGGVLQCLPIFSMALSCQMQIFEVFTSINNQSLEKLNSIVRNATWICTLVYIAVGFFGYVAFCNQIFSGNILMNLSHSLDSDAIKIGFILSLAFSFPLVIFPCRASLYSLLYRKGQTDASGYIPETRFKAITIFIVSFALCVALMIPSVELVIGLVGSTIGVAICVIFPAACFRRIIKKETRERKLAQIIVISGFCLMILGTYANLLAIDAKSSGSHLDVPKIDEEFIKPTEFANAVIDERIKSIEKALKEKDKEKAEKNKVIQSKGQQQNDHLNKTKYVAKEKPSPPPLPVDEPHPVIAKGSQLTEKLEIHLLENKPLENLNPPKNQISKIEINKAIANLTNNLPEGKVLENEASTYQKQIEEKKATTNGIVLQPQTIDNDAIKKDEEVAKEEIKEQNEELQKTQKELEQTKDLLNKKVEELKQELVKQNLETQNLVAEKLDQVVEKFEAIERKVQQKKEEIAQPKILENTPQNIDNDTNHKKANKGSLISILTENKTPDSKTKPAEKVYEPLSYKTGELMKHAALNTSGLDKRLPIPLALLLNVSQDKINETLYIKPNMQIIPNLNEAHKERQENNVPQQLPAKNDAADSFSLHRNKRSCQSLEDNENCLGVANTDNHITTGVDTGLEMKIGRDLKSLKDEK